MVISFLKIFILFAFFQLYYLHDFFDYSYLSNQLKNDSSDDILKNRTIEELVQLMPVASLAYIIRGFLPNIPKIYNSTTNEPINIDLVKKLLNTSCFQNLLLEYRSRKNQLFDTIRYSGKTYPDFGDEEGCIKKQNAFLLISINFDIKSPGDYTGKYRILPFITNGFSFYGLCIKDIYICTDGLVEGLSDDINFIKSLPLINNTYDIDVLIDHPGKEAILKYPKRKTIFQALFYIVHGYFGLRIIVALFGLNFFKEDDLEKKKSSDSDSSSDDEEEEDEEDNSKNLNKSDDNQNNNLLIEKNNNDKVLNKDKYPKLYFFYILCSIKLSFRNLLRFKGILYEETDLYIIIFFKTLSLLLRTLYMINYLMIFTPSKEMNNIAFFDSYIIHIIRYSSFTDIIFIMTESILVAYKLMAFIRKYTDNNKSPSYKLFINFFFRIIPSFITTTIYFFIFYFLSEGMMSYLMKNYFSRTRMMHFRKNLIYCHTCVNDKKALIPFYIQYQNFFENFSNNTECFHFMIIMTNLFYCYLLVILLTYISYKVKNSKCDKLLVIVFFMYFIVPNNWLCNVHYNDYFNIHFLFGERYATKYTHLFIKYYFYGFLIGLSIFYNNDITHEKSMQNSFIHKPFYFLQDIMGYMFLRSFWVKILIIVSMAIIQILLSLTFFFYSSFDFSLYIKSKTVHKLDHYLHINEKTIFSLVFGIMIMVIYTFKNESIVKGITQNIVFVLFNRIGYAYYALIEIMINYMYCFMELEVQLNSLNILFITVGVIFYLLIINVILIALFEIPVKILTKKMLKKETEDKQFLVI